MFLLCVNGICTLYVMHADVMDFGLNILSIFNCVNTPFTHLEQRQSVLENMFWIYPSILSSYLSDNIDKVNMVNKTNVSFNLSN